MLIVRVLISIGIWSWVFGPLTLLFTAIFFPFGVLSFLFFGWITIIYVFNTAGWGFDTEDNSDPSSEARYLHSNLKDRLSNIHTSLPTGNDGTQTIKDIKHHTENTQESIHERTGMVKCPDQTLVKKLYRSETDKWISGICGGLGEYLNVSPAIIRIALVIITIITMPLGAIVYAACVFFVPRNPDR
jgi:phage shock protein C